MVSVFSIKSESKNRTRLEIVRDLLQAASEKSRKTRIMYSVNLSYQLMQKYLGSMLESGLVECVDEAFYVITGKGKEFLQLYEEYRERCQRIGKAIRDTRKDRLLLEELCFNNACNAQGSEASEDACV